MIMENYLRIWYNDNFVNKYNHDDFLKIVLKDCYSKMVFTNRLKICLIFPSTLSRSIYFVSSHSSTPPLGSQAVAWGTKATSPSVISAGTFLLMFTLLCLIFVMDHDTTKFSLSYPKMYSSSLGFLIPGTNNTFFYSRNFLLTSIV